MKKDQRLAQILRHAAQVFYEKGYDRASIRDIARDADMSLAGLYYYFESKEELLYLIQKEVFTNLLERVREKLDGEADPVTRLKVFTHNHLDYFIGNLVEMKVLSHEFEALEGKHHDGIAQLRREYYEVAEEIVGDILAKHPANKLTARIAALGLLGMMNWLYTWYRPDSDGDAEQVSDQITELYLGGLLGGR